MHSARTTAGASGSEGEGLGFPAGPGRIEPAQGPRKRKSSSGSVESGPRKASISISASSGLPSGSRVAARRDDRDPSGRVLASTCGGEKLRGRQ